MNTIMITEMFYIHVIIYDIFRPINGFTAIFFLKMIKFCSVKLRYIAFFVVKFCVNLDQLTKRYA